MSQRKRSGGDPSVRRRKQAERKQRAADATAPEPGYGPMRLNRYLARAGVASRRASDDIIAAGRVTVNGETVTELGVKVPPDARVEVDGRAIAPAASLTLLLNKPHDCITTVRDDRGRRTVMDLIELPESQTRGLVPVGRLDRETTGALLLTTDGDLAHRLMHPRYEVEKLYVATLDTPFEPIHLEKLRQGIHLGDGLSKADHAMHPDEGDRRTVALQIHEGRNRQVRRTFAALGYTVEKLARVRYAGLDLSGLRPGRWRRLLPHEVASLRRSVKLKPSI